MSAKAHWRGLSAAPQPMTHAFLTLMVVAAFVGGGALAWLPIDTIPTPDEQKPVLGDPGLPRRQRLAIARGRRPAFLTSSEVAKFIGCYLATIPPSPSEKRRNLLIELRGPLSHAPEGLARFKLNVPFSHRWRAYDGAIVFGIHGTSFALIGETRYEMYLGRERLYPRDVEHWVKVPFKRVKCDPEEWCTPDSEPVGVGGEVVPPHAVSRVLPRNALEYEVARTIVASGQRIRVATVYPEIDGNGDVTDVEVLSSVDPAVDADVVAAVKQWKFQPATLCGRPVRSKLVLGIHFR